MKENMVKILQAHDKHQSINAMTGVNEIIFKNLADIYNNK